jgi:hypothetical protein
MVLSIEKPKQTAAENFKMNVGEENSLSRGYEVQRCCAPKPMLKIN